MAAVTVTVVVVVVRAVVVVSVAVLEVVAHGSLLALDGSGRAEKRSREELYRKE
jgi:hypothetical protein